LQYAKECCFKVAHTATLASTLSSIGLEIPDVIILDLGLPDSEGVEVVTKLHAICSQVPIIVMTGIDDEKVAMEAVRRGAQEYLLKGQVETKFLGRIIRYSIERKRIEEDLKRNKHEQQVIFDSVPAMIWYKDKENRFIRANKAAAASIGLSVEEVEGKSAYDLYPEEAKKYGLIDEVMKEKPSKSK